MAAKVAVKRGSEEEAMSTIQQAKAKAALMAIQQRMGAEASSSSAMAGDGQMGEFSDEIEINDYPQQARWKVTHKASIQSILEMADIAVTTRGSYIPAGRKPPPGVRKLYLLIEGKLFFFDIACLVLFRLLHLIPQFNSM